MSKVKSFSVGAGDMFYISHNSDNFTTIDCCLDYDEDHISGLKEYDKEFNILNFHRVNNNTTKEGAYQ